MALRDVRHALSEELLLVLQHSDLSSNSTAVCKLLCVSKGMQAAIMGIMAGEVTVALYRGSLSDVVSEQVQSFAAFVRKFGMLMKNLDIFAASYIELQTVAAAIQYAALRPPGLHIQSFTSSTPAAQLMDQLLLFRTSLTNLQLDWFGLKDDEISSGHEVILPSLQTTQLALAGLPNLSSLSLKYYTDPSPDSTDSRLWRSLSSLTAVTQLRIKGNIDPQDFSYLPTQLKELCVAFPGHPAHEGDWYNLLGVDLTHLTALTVFGTWLESEAKEVHIVTAADRFPSSLCQMELGDVQSVQPLLQLTRLQQLRLLECVQPPDTVAQLSKLTSLTSLDLTYYVYKDWETSPEGLPAAASADEHPASSAPFAIFSHAMPSLPLRRLMLILHGAPNTVSLTSDWACLLGKLTGLTSLELFADNISASPQQLAKSLSQMPHLQVLMLHNIETSSFSTEHVTAEQPPGAVSGAKELLRAIAGRPQLQSLHLPGIPITTDLAEELRLLGGASQLTSLVLEGCCLTDTAGAVFLPSVPTGLKELSLWQNPQVGDATLELIGQKLPHLTKLNLRNTAVTDRGLVHLTSLWLLKELLVSETKAT